jgi:hypothetical protein
MPAEAGGTGFPRRERVSVGAIRGAQAFAAAQEKKKAPEGAFNMLRLVRQAD